MFKAIKQIFRSRIADERQGFLAGLFSSGAWVLPVSAAAFAGRFQNEIQTFVQDVLSKFYFTYLSSKTIGMNNENPFSIIQYHLNLFSTNYIRLRVPSNIIPCSLIFYFSNINYNYNGNDNIKR